MQAAVAEPDSIGCSAAPAARDALNALRTDFFLRLVSLAVSVSILETSWMLRCKEGVFKENGGVYIM